MIDMIFHVVKYKIEISTSQFKQTIRQNSTD